MTEPVTSVEIEDVLSSIRRLVTEEGRSSSRKPEAPQKPRPRLVLTPALRVGDRSLPPEEDPSDDAALVTDTSRPLQLTPAFSAPDSSDEIMFHHTAVRRGDDRDGDEGEDAAEQTALPEADPEPIEPVEPPASPAMADAELAPEPVAEDVPDAELQDAVAAEAEVMEAEAEPEPQDDVPGMAEAAAPEPGMTGEDVADDLAEPEAEPFDTVAEAFAEPDADMSELVTDTATEPESESDAPEMAAEAEPETEEPAQAPAEQRMTDRTASLSAKIMALEAAIAQTQDQWEPDRAGESDYAGTPVKPLQWEDAGPAPEAPREEAQDMAGIEDGFLDEEALRELVADIVRQELQGALGERITRNVRKLVRREIHRALTTQDLE